MTFVIGVSLTCPVVKKVSMSEIDYDKSPKLVLNRAIFTSIETLLLHVLYAQDIAAR